MLNFSRTLRFMARWKLVPLTGLLLVWASCTNSCKNKSELTKELGFLPEDTVMLAKFDMNNLMSSSVISKKWTELQADDDFKKDAGQKIKKFNTACGITLEKDFQSVTMAANKTGTNQAIIYRTNKMDEELAIKCVKEGLGQEIKPGGESKQGNHKIIALQNGKVFFLPTGKDWIVMTTPEWQKPILDLYDGVAKRSAKENKDLMAMVDVMSAKFSSNTIAWGVAVGKEALNLVPKGGPLAMITASPSIKAGYFVAGINDDAQLEVGVDMGSSTDAVSARTEIDKAISGMKKQPKVEDDMLKGVKIETKDSMLLISAHWDKDFIKRQVDSLVKEKITSGSAQY